MAFGAKEVEDRHIREKIKGGGGGGNDDWPENGIRCISSGSGMHSHPKVSRRYSKEAGKLRGPKQRCGQKQDLRS